MKSNQQTLCPMVGGLMELNKGKRISGSELCLLCRLLK